jgi:hypothetical protein
MTPARGRARRRTRTAGAIVATALWLPIGIEAAAQEPTDPPTEVSPTPTPPETTDEEPATETTRRPASSGPPTSDTDDPAGAFEEQQSWRLRVRVKPNPPSGYGAPKKVNKAMGRVRAGSCGQTRDLLWDGEPKVSRVRLKMIRQQGDADALAANPPSGSCAVQKQRISGFKLRAKVSYPKPAGGRGMTGRLKLAAAFVKLAQHMNGIRDKVLVTGFVGKFKIRLIRIPKTVPGMIRGLAKRYALSASQAVGVAACESGFNPNAYSTGNAGVYQQDVSYWPQRASAYGHSGESVYNAYANIDVSLKMARNGGWGGWAGCA